MPDKAIDLIDEAASKVHIDMESKPAEIVNLDKKIKLLQDNEEAASLQEDFAKAAEYKSDRLKIEQEAQSKRSQMEKRA